MSRGPRWPTLRRAALLAAVAAGLCGIAPAALATVCVATASALSFGIYDTLASGANDSTATVTVVCTPTLGAPLTTSYTITIAGTGTGNDTVRSASAGTKRLYFQVYKDASRSLVWGNGSTSGSGVAGSVTSAAVAVPALRVHTAYARMGPGQNVGAAIYLGSLLVSVDY